MEALMALLGATGAICYPFLEARWFRIKRLQVSLGRAVPRVSVLHVSDTHLTARNKALIRFLGSLPGRFEIPDLVLATGDLIEDNSGITPLAKAFDALPAKRGRYYVLGSHDYYQTRFQSYFKYLKKAEPSMKAPPADTAALETKLRSSGWVSLTNRTEQIETSSGSIRLSGVDDPYIKRHRTTHIARAGGDALAIGLVHAPDVVSEWMLNGFDLVLTGHTHAGQVRLPGLGALVTNSSLPSALAGGLHRIGSSWLHASPGLGTGKFSPFRFNCRPEVTFLEIGP